MKQKKLTIKSTLVTKLSTVMQTGSTTTYTNTLKYNRLYYLSHGFLYFGQWEIGAISTGTYDK
jgi:hypothetical protein